MLEGKKVFVLSCQREKKKLHVVPVTLYLDDFIYIRFF